MDYGDSDRSGLVLAATCGIPRPAGIWHELHPIIVELSRNDNGPFMLSVGGSDWVHSLEDLVVGEWVGPLVPLE